MPTAILIIVARNCNGPANEDELASLIMGHETFVLLAHLLKGFQLNLVWDMFALPFSLLPHLLLKLLLKFVYILLLTCSELYQSLIPSVFLR